MEKGELHEEELREDLDYWEIFIKSPPWKRLVDLMERQKQARVNADLCIDVEKVEDLIEIAKHREARKTYDLILSLPGHIMGEIREDIEDVVKGR